VGHPGHSIFTPHFPKGKTLSISLSNTTGSPKGVFPFSGNFSGAKWGRGQCDFPFSFFTNTLFSTKGPTILGISAHLGTPFLLFLYPQKHFPNTSRGFLSLQGHPFFPFFFTLGPNRISNTFFFGAHTLSLGFWHWPQAHFTPFFSGPHPVVGFFFPGGFFPFFHSLPKRNGSGFNFPFGAEIFPWALSFGPRWGTFSQMWSPAIFWGEFLSAPLGSLVFCAPL